MRSFKWTLVVGVVVMGVVGTVMAGGAPSSSPLVYSGTLQDSVGAPLSGQQEVTVRLFPIASGGVQACATTPQMLTPDPLGRFSVQLGAACADQVRAQPDLFIELQVNSTVLPRVKLNAVPYALEADRSNVAGRVVRNSITFPDGGTTRPLSFNGAFCGATGPLNGGRGGYRGLKAQCESTCGSSTAHVCSTQEAVSSFSIGLSLPTGWLSGAHIAFGTATSNYDDCMGFTIGTAASNAPVWEPSGRVSGAFCNESRPFLCCD
ncbi:MAG: hypothetical protein Q8S33_18090 [Myxococcales bacterium]|nr:hypothetical protein [Myxococcales bacterium]